MRGLRTGTDPDIKAQAQKGASAADKEAVLRRRKSSSGGTCSSYSRRGFALRSNRPMLLVEDDKADQLLFRRALKSLGIADRLVIVNSGEEAIEYLRGCMHEDRPFLIFADVSMPGMSGIEFLAALKRATSLRMLPVVMLTTSKEPKGISDCFRLGASGYLAKPVDFCQFIEAIETAYKYWTLNELPE